MSKIGWKGQKGQLSKIVANSLKHVENQYCIEITAPNHDFSTFSLSIVKYLDLENFIHCISENLQVPSSLL